MSRPPEPAGSGKTLVSLCMVPNLLPVGRISVEAVLRLLHGCRPGSFFPLGLMRAWECTPTPRGVDWAATGSATCRSASRDVAEWAADRQLSRRVQHGHTGPSAPPRPSGCSSCPTWCPSLASRSLVRRSEAGGETVARRRDHVARRRSHTLWLRSL